MHRIAIQAHERNLNNRHQRAVVTGVLTTFPTQKFLIETVVSEIRPFAAHSERARASESQPLLRAAGGEAAVSKSRSLPPAPFAISHRRSPKRALRSQVFRSTNSRQATVAGDLSIRLHVKSLVSRSPQ